MATPMVQPRGAAPAPVATAAAVTPRGPTGPSTPAPAAPAAPAPDEGAGAGIPDAVAQLPTITALLGGEPAATSLDIKRFDKREEAKVLAEGAQALQQAGVGFYTSLDGSTGVMFNQMFISPEEIQSADKAGKLLEVAPPFDEVAKAVTGGDPTANPALEGMKRHTGALAGAPAPSPDQSASAAAANMKIPGAGAPGKQKMRAEMQSMGAPSSGPKPGSGRLLNSILKPVV